MAFGQVIGNFGPVRQNLENVCPCRKIELICTRCVSPSTMSRFRKNSSQSSISTIGGPFLRAGYDTVPLTSFFHLGVTPTSGSASLHYCYIAPPSRVATPDCDPSYGALDEPELPKESAWRTAYGAASMAVEITKGSSDMFPLLKAVTDALSVFTRNYDVSSSQASHSPDR